MQAEKLLWISPYITKIPGILIFYVQSQGLDSLPFDHELISNLKSSISGIQLTTGNFQK
jgi:hypothetical protein